MSTSEKTLFKRLPTDVVPQLYEVTLKPDLVELTFQGWEVVHLMVKSVTSSITVNGFEITVSEASLSGKDSGKTLVPEIEHQPNEEKILFHFSEGLQPGEYLLKLQFTGSLNDQLRGFYRNKYTTPSGEQRYGAGTHFEATGARRAYPCWDEPAVKAKFVFTLVVPQDRLALSNMPVEEEKPSPENPDLRMVKFEPTPTMSTYLTAFVVGEYDCVEDTTSNGVPVRVFTPVGKKEQGRFALEVATKALSYYEWYFDVPYGLPKLDLITLSEFPIGAMENWGLVTYRETCLLVDSVHSSALTRQRVAVVVAHELSHNWFGNLVTMEWWTDLWLKEGFATWIEYQCVASLYPEMDVWMTFINGDQAYALKLDALSTSHPVEVEVGHPGEIDEIFDGISYCKGACLIRMLQSHIGDEAFRKGMKLYLNRHKFSNTNTSNMWAAMSESSGEDVGQLMDSWTKQMGFPLIKVEEVIDTNSEQRQVVLSQEKFTSQVPSGDEAKSSARWRVPYSITTARSPEKPVVKGVLADGSVTLTVPDCAPGDWIRVNPGQFMFYHVQYSPEALQRFLPALISNVLGPVDRLGLLTDLLALCRANYINAVDVLRLTKSYRSEKNFAVCSKLTSALADLGSQIQQLTEGSFSRYKTFVCDSLRDTGERLGWEAQSGEDHGDKMLREQVLTRLGRSGEEKVKEEAFRRFEAHFAGQQVLSGDIKAPVYTTVLTHGGKAVFEKMLQLYDREDSLEEKNRIGRLLGCVSDAELIQSVLKFALSDKVRNQDSVAVLGGVRASLQGKELLWSFVKENWSELYRRYGTSTMLSGLIKVLTEGVGCADQAADIEKFFKSHKAKAAERAIQQGLEHISSNVAFLRKQGSSILEFLKTEA
ncbi:puromycin-sensitive aminopeptidase [Aplysia californica]|uniref:Aminopeptidase n=1 Tax=Aplysia californica TaxID=6500 RepID=A0ABM1W3Q3_APLCA|nr:puromycin-sensitive aminopeptidase [Aplysia californica]XP_012945741.1 puromycin-sensitive aminopeptidase [Aplysia californica]XP_035829296.1 puromycin-sensitive aminopeptidase [Aplysia californica]